MGFMLLLARIVDGSRMFSWCLLRLSDLRVCEAAIGSGAGNGSKLVNCEPAKVRSLRRSSKHCGIRLESASVSMSCRSIIVTWTHMVSERGESQFPLVCCLVLFEMSRFSESCGGCC